MPEREQQVGQRDKKQNDAEALVDSDQFTRCAFGPKLRQTWVAHSPWIVNCHRRDITRERGPSRRFAHPASASKQECAPLVGSTHVRPADLWIVCGATEREEQSLALLTHDGRSKQ
jgi:hypothetical protein